MVRRFVCLALLVLGAGALLLTVPASAQTPNPNSNYQGCQAFVSDVTVVPGQTTTISGSGANPGDTVTAVINPTTVGTGVADANGNFSFQGTIPDTLAPGTYTLTVTCGPNGGVALITVTAGVPRSGTGPVARTGAGHTIPLMKLGVALIAAGGLMFAGARRRRWARQPAVTG